MPKGLIILLFSCLSLRASPIPPRHHFFNHISKSSGLVSYQVNSVVQDNEGFIWIGTNEGLQRFDGIHYRNFQHLQNDPSSIPSNFVRQLLLDKAGNLWLLSKEGTVAIFDRHRFVSSAIPVKTSYVNALSTTTNSKRLISEESGAVFLLLEGYELLTYNPGDHRFSAATIPGLPPNLKMMSFTPEPGTHRYWYASDSGGLAVSELTKGAASTPKTLEPEIKSLQSAGNISIIWFDHRHRLWTVRIVDNLPEISCFDMKQSRIILSRYRLDARSIGHHEVGSFYETRDGSVWIRGQQVLAKFIEDKKEFEQVYNGVEEEHGIDYVMITCLLEDREGGMWVGTANNGLFYFYPSMEFFTNTTYRSNFTGKKGDGAPGAFLTDKDSSLLVGIHDEGLYRFDRNMKQIPLQISGIPETNSLSVWDMRRGNRHESWIAVTHGLYRFDPEVRKSESFFPKIFEHLTVWQVCPDSAGNLWIGTLEAGLFFWDKTLGARDFDKGLKPVAGVPPVRINRILADHFGLIWIATANQGVYLIQPREAKIVRHFTSQENGACRLPEASVNAMTECGDSLMVMACPGLISLYHWKGDSVEWLRHPLSGTAASVEADDRGHIWVSSSTTLFRVTLSQKTFIYYDRSDGLANDGFVANGSAVFGGRLLFGAYGAIISFKPKEVLTGPVIPDFKLTEVTVSGQQLRVDSLMQAGIFTLSPEDNNIAFAFSAMVYNSGYLLRYSLSGLGKNGNRCIKNTG